MYCNMIFTLYKTLHSTFTMWFTGNLRCILLSVRSDCSTYKSTFHVYYSLCSIHFCTFQLYLLFFLFLVGICTESECDSCGMEICINEKQNNIELENVVENCSTNRLFQKRRNINALIFPIKIEHVRRETTLYAVLEPSSQFSGIFMWTLQELP